MWAFAIVNRKSGMKSSSHQIVEATKVQNNNFCRHSPLEDLVRVPIVMPTRFFWVALLAGVAGTAGWHGWPGQICLRTKESLKTLSTTFAALKYKGLLPCLSLLRL
jgi:hypothetical protein